MWKGIILEDEEPRRLGEESIDGQRRDRQPASDGPRSSDRRRGHTTAVAADTITKDGAGPDGWTDDETRTDKQIRVDERDAEQGYFFFFFEEQCDGGKNCASFLFSLTNNGTTTVSPSFSS